MAREKSEGRPPSPITWDTVARTRPFPFRELKKVRLRDAPLKVKGKLLVRLHQDLEDTVVVKIEIGGNGRPRIRTNPAVFFITDHYRDAPWCSSG